jgi:hypothetical protein
VRPFRESRVLPPPKTQRLIGSHPIAAATALRNPNLNILSVCMVASYTKPRLNVRDTFSFFGDNSRLWLTSDSLQEAFFDHGLRASYQSHTCIACKSSRSNSGGRCEAEQVRKARRIRHLIPLLSTTTNETRSAARPAHRNIFLSVYQRAPQKHLTRISNP